MEVEQSTSSSLVLQRQPAASSQQQTDISDPRGTLRGSYDRRLVDVSINQSHPLKKVGGIYGGSAVSAA